MAEQQARQLRLGAVSSCVVRTSARIGDVAAIVRQPDGQKLAFHAVEQPTRYAVLEITA